MDASGGSLGIARELCPASLERAIQELTGRRDLGLTQRYMHLSPGALDSAFGCWISRFPYKVSETFLETGRVSEEKING
jgi:hypothetical protein